MLNIGGIIFLLFSILVPAIFIGGVMFFVRSSKMRKEQLTRIEEKVDRLSGQSSEKEF